MCLPYSEEQCVKGTLLEPQHPRMPFRKLCETYGIKKRYLKQKTRNNSGVVIVVLCERWNWPGVRKLPLRTDGTWISLYCYCAQNLTKTDRRDARASCLAYGGWLGADVLSHRPLHGSERGVGAACSAPPLTTPWFCTQADAAGTPPPNANSSCLLSLSFQVP